jgi:hypothetical protein
MSSDRQLELGTTPSVLNINIMSLEILSVSVRPEIPKLSGELIELVSGVGVDCVGVCRRKSEYHKEESF